jgi:putative zinc finger protein
MNCYETIDVMGDEVEGILEDALRAGFDEHIAECPSCSTYLDQLRLTRRALRLLPRGGPTSPHREDLVEQFLRSFGRSGD